jgi:hypothetical protein
VTCGSATQRRSARICRLRIWSAPSLHPSPKHWKVGKSTGCLRIILGRHLTHSFQRTGGEGGIRTMPAPSQHVTYSLYEKAETLKSGKTPVRGTRQVHETGGGTLSERPNLEKTIRAFALRLKRDFAAELARDARAFKRRCVHLLRADLPPGPGRPLERSVTLALTMRDQGKDWREIYPLCIENCAALDPPSRQLAQHRLRDSCRARRNTRKRRKSRRVSPARRMPVSIVSSSEPMTNPLA